MHVARLRAELTPLNSSTGSLAVLYSEHMVFATVQLGVVEVWNHWTESEIIRSRNYLVDFIS